MKTHFLILFGLFLLGCTALYAQKIQGVKFSLFEKNTNDYWLRVAPNMFDGNVAETIKTSGVYALMICYTYNGKSKSVYQDVTSKFVNGEEYTYTFSYGSTNLEKLVVNNVTFFRRDKDRSTYPDKDNCNSGSVLSGANSYGTSLLYNR